MTKFDAFSRQTYEGKRLGSMFFDSVDILDGLKSISHVRSVEYHMLRALWYSVSIIYFSFNDISFRSASTMN